MKLLLPFFSTLESSSDRYQECVQIVIDNSNGLEVNLAEYMLEKIDLTRESYSDFDLLSFKYNKCGACRQSCLYSVE